MAQNKNNGYGDFFFEAIIKFLKMHYPEYPEERARAELYKFTQMYDPDSEDMFAYIVFGVTTGLQPVQIVATIMHDIQLIQEDPKFSSPRTSGYYTNFFVNVK